MPAWVEQGCADYARRMPREYQLDWQELAPVDRNGAVPVEQAKAQEGERILARLDRDEWMIALDERGQQLDTLGWAGALRDWQMEARKPVFVIGGADGLDDHCLGRAQQRWSLSRLTFPHPLVRVLLIEQLYRAAMVNAGHPYHRA